MTCTHHALSATVRLGLSTGACVGFGMRDGQQRRQRLDGYADALGEVGTVQALRLEVEHQLRRRSETPDRPPKACADRNDGRGPRLA